MRVAWHDESLSVQDRAEIESWVEAHDRPAIRDLTIYATGIVLYLHDGRSSLSVRGYFKSLTAALDNAFTTSSPSRSPGRHVLSKGRSAISGRSPTAL